MSAPISNMVTVMISAGIPPEIIALAVRTAEEHAQSLYGTDPVAAKRRAYDRERKRSKAEIPPERETAISILDSKDSKKEKKERAVREKGQKLPDDWCAKPNHFAEGYDLGFSQPEVSSQAEDLRIWARANEHRAVARKANWDLTFSGWMRRNRPKGSKPPTAPTNAPTGFYAAFQSPELDAWNEYERTIGKTEPRDKRGGWTYPSQWPPKLKIAAVG